MGDFMRKGVHAFEIIQILASCPAAGHRSGDGRELEVTVRSIPGILAHFRPCVCPSMAKRGIGYVLRPAFTFRP